MTAVIEAAGPAPLLAVRNLAKSFGPTPALAGADFRLREREIHALLGTSGAGKSTLLDIVSGLHTSDSGEIVFRGFPIRLRSRRDAFRVGISVVGQKAAVVPDMTVFENIVMPNWGRPGRHEPPDLRKRVVSVLSSFGWTDALPLDGHAGRLTNAQRRLLEITRGFCARAKVFILDEPFASLSPRDIDSLVGVMMRLRLSGCGLIVAASRLEEVVTVADRVTVLCEGRTTVDAALAIGSDHAHLRRAMGLVPDRGTPPDHPGTKALVALNVHGLRAPPTVAEVSFTVHRGEVVGLHGLRGAGRVAVFDALAGLGARTAGRVEVAGAPLPPGDPKATRQGGLAFVAADRPLPLPLATARANLRLLTPGRGAAASPWPIEELWRSLKLPAEWLDAPLSGAPAAIRQRIALACGLACGRPVLLLDEPLRGLDAVARAAARASLREAGARGLAIALTASDPDDLLAVAHRIVVIREGHSVADLPSAMADAEALTLLATPAAALARNTAALTELTRENGGAAFWVLLREDHAVCLNAVVADARGDPGLRAARAARFADTRIATALRRGETEFVTEPDGARATVLVPIQTRRGQPIGWIGLTLPTTSTLPPASAVAFRIATLAAQL